MLPDFPKAKAKANRFFLKTIQQKVASSPLLAEIRHSQQHEGKSSILRREDSSEARIEFRHASQTVTTTRDEMRDWDPEAFGRKVIEIADGIEKAQTLALFEEIQRATEETGNTIDAGGKGLQKEQFLEMQRKILHSFDPVTEEPTGAMMVIHPDMVPQIKKAMEEWENDEAFMLELKRVQEEKREEWRAREASRKLVD
jgi:hypothetical protein